MLRFFLPLVILVGLGSGSCLRARELPVPPDMKSIRAAVKDAAGPMYYPRLFNRYLAGDSTLTLAKKRHLYYGYSTDASYSPYGGSDFQDSIKAILKEEHLVEPDYIRLLAFNDSVLKSTPFSIRQLALQVNAARKLNNPSIALLAHTRMDVVIDAIKSSGDGRSIKTAYWVTEVAHEYSMINILGYKFGGSQKLVDGPCDYLTLEENADGLKGLYFNVSISMSVLDDIFKDSKPALPTDGKKKRKSR